MKMLYELNPGGSRRRDKLDLVTAVPVLRCRRINDESGLWLRGWADALTPCSSRRTP